MKNFKEQFIEKSKSKFKDKFDYSKVNYKNATTPIILICKEHGEFSMQPKSHLNSKTGCIECSKKVQRKKKVLINNTDRKQMREYSIWKALRNRISNHNRNDAKYYADKGISICDRWNSFENFYKDMGECPNGYTIDRIDPNGNYCPENCRWANMITQSQNRGDFNLVYTYKGETHVLKEWAKILKIKYTTLYMRIYRSGLSFEEAIQKDPFKRQIKYNGESHTLKEWCELKNMEYNVVLNRIDKHKWTFDEAITVPKGGKRKK